jgi:hypothetical protein
MPPGLTVETLVLSPPQVAEDAVCRAARSRTESLPADAAFRPYSVANGANGGIRLSHCDEIYVRISRAPSSSEADKDTFIDLTGIYFGANGDFFPMQGQAGSRSGQKCNERDASLRPGECFIMRIRTVRTTDTGAQDPFGVETIGLIAVSRTGQTPRIYRDIQSPPRRRVGEEVDPFAQALHQAYSQPGTRTAPQPPAPTAVMMIPIDFLPREMMGEGQ